MSPRAENVLHSIVALALTVVAIAGVTWLGYSLAGTRGLRGESLNIWMTLWFAGALGAGAVVFIAYRRWFLRSIVDRREAQRSQEADDERRKNMARIDAQQEALRQALRATPGLERYAELIGRSTIGSVEDARVREARVAELRADPAKSKYAERVFKGELITDRMIAYLEDPGARVLCEHLVALEADVRMADPRAAPSADHTLEANLGFDFDAVKRRYALGDCISFWRREFGPQYHGRGEDNYDGAERIECTQHGCALNGSELRRKFIP